MQTISKAEEFAFIDTLLSARQFAKKSQSEVAYAMKTTPSVVSRLEAGGGSKQHHSPSLSTLRRYAHAVGCKLQLKLVPERVGRV